MNKTDYFCRLIRHAANVPVERIQLNEFVPTREALNSRAKAPRHWQRFRVVRRAFWWVIIRIPFLGARGWILVQIGLFSLYHKRCSEGMFESRNVEWR